MTCHAMKQLKASPDGGWGNIISFSANRSQHQNIRRTGPIRKVEQPYTNTRTHTNLRENYILFNLIFPIFCYGKHVRIRTNALS